MPVLRLRVSADHNVMVGDLLEPADLLGADIAVGDLGQQKDRCTLGLLDADQQALPQTRRVPEFLGRHGRR